MKNLSLDKIFGQKMKDYPGLKYRSLELRQLIMVLS